jgi:hypothetical protein
MPVQYGNDHAFISKRLRNYWKKHGTSILNKPVAFKKSKEAKYGNYV